MSHHRRRARGSAACLAAGEDASTPGQAAPVIVPGGGWRLRAAPAPGEALRHGAGWGAVAPGGDRPRSWRRDEGARLALPRGVRQAGQRRLPSGGGPEQEHGRCRTRPRARGRADRRAGGAGAVPRRCLGARDAAARRDHSLAPGAAGQGRPRGEPEHTHHRADAGDSGPLGARRRLGWRGGLDERQRDGAAPPLLMVQQGQVPLATWRHGGSQAACRHAIPLGLGGQWRPERGEGVRAGGLREVRAPRGALTRQRPAGAGPHGAARRGAGSRSGRWWPCPHGALAETGRGPGQPAALPAPPGR